MLTQKNLKSDLTSRMTAVQSPIISTVGNLILSNPGTISLGLGVVYYNPPPEAIASLSQFLAEPNNHKYQALIGIPPLISAIQTKLKADNHIEINDSNCIVVTAGSNMGFMNVILAITNPGDEIIIQSPYFFNHEMTIMMANCRPVIVATDTDYQLRPDAIVKAITDKTKAIVTISPNNPTGVVYGEAALREVNEICRDRGIYHISDEVYEYFTYNGVKHISPGSFLDSSDYTISLYSLSKAYGLASWRIGYMVIPAHLLSSVEKVQEINLICPPVISQYAALGALQVGKKYCEKYVAALASVRKLVFGSLQKLGGSCTIGSADGGLYFFLKVNTQLESFELVKRLIKEHKVAVLPGTTFGMENGCYLRVAYGALEQETVVEGIERLVQGLSAILLDD